VFIEPPLGESFNFDNGLPFSSTLVEVLPAGREELPPTTARQFNKTSFFKASKCHSISYSLVFIYQLGLTKESGVIVSPSRLSELSSKS
jgi:hypothetical protein